MVCAIRQNDVRSWQKWCARHFGCNGRPWENDVRVGVRVDVRAGGWGACSAAHIIFTRMRKLQLVGHRLPAWLRSFSLAGSVSSARGSPERLLGFTNGVF